MSILQGVLLEEIERLEKNISNYINMLSSLPRGTIFIRKMGNSSYVYRKRKEKGVVISEYLGKSEDEEVKKQIELSNEYKRIHNNLKTTEKELKRLRKAYKTYDRK